jgi:hypothetical protein
VPTPDELRKLRQVRQQHQTQHQQRLRQQQVRRQGLEVRKKPSSAKEEATEDAATPDDPSSSVPAPKASLMALYTSNSRLMTPARLAVDPPPSRPPTEQGPPRPERGDGARHHGHGGVTAGQRLWFRGGGQPDAAGQLRLVEGCQVHTPVPRVCWGWTRVGGWVRVGGSAPALEAQPGAATQPGVRERPTLRCAPSSPAYPSRTPPPPHPSPSNLDGHRCST